MPTYCRTFPGHVEQVGCARRWAREVLTGCSCAGDAVLIVSELGTNAVTHTTSPDFHVTIHRARGSVTITVTDHGGSTTAPHLAKPYDHGMHGRGLAVVTTLATDVRFTRNAHGHEVAAHLASEVPAC
ncbi:ATP-binding protein [Streptomyces marispadix]|uniref:ATP-binding protein n=1 Tax=Streptomyces marispadix TaxID=2922868 RepID=A0ABS9T2X6_9ACTN|nr:ATP-binding protein [Streptomyces marispadix]MCH6162885.1 ATP-binding protein [Streptomyces marispadix]